MAEGADTDVAGATDAAEAHDALPAPAPLKPPRGPVQWRVVRAALVAAVVAFAGGAVAGDARTDEGDEAAIASGTAVAVPVLAPAVGDDLSAAVSSYGIAPWSSPTRSVVLGAWGASAVDLETGGLGQAVPDVGGEPLLADDPRLADPAAPAFVDPCAVRGEPPGDCPASERALAATVLGASDQPANAVVVRPYPQGDTALAETCGFPDVEPDQIPVAVVTANPGAVQLTVGSERVVARSSGAERTAWAEWRAHALGTRPPSTFVAHCLVVDRPDGPGPFPVEAVATDDAGGTVVAEGAVVPLGAGRVPASVVVLDSSLLQVEVPTTAGSAPASVVAVPLAALGGVADCGAAAQVAPTLPVGWRAGAASRVTPPAVGGARPYLAATPQVDRVVVPVAEGEPSLLCIRTSADAAEPAAALVVTPPDARRLRLAVTELRLDRTPDAAVEVTGTFAELGWTPCGARVAGAAAPPEEEGTPTGPDAEAPVDPEAPLAEVPVVDPVASSPTELAVLCTSGGDAGAVVAAGGLLDLAVTAGSATYAARIALDPTPGAAPSRSYRLPIPSGEVDAGGLCTAGVAAPGCRPPRGDNVVGSLVVTASWDEGPVGPAEWGFAAPS